MDDTRFCAADELICSLNRPPTPSSTMFLAIAISCASSRVGFYYFKTELPNWRNGLLRPVIAKMRFNIIKFNRRRQKLHVVSMYERTTPAVPSGLALEIGLFCRKSVHSLLTMSVSLPIERKHFGNSKQGQYGNRFGVNDGGRLFDKCEIF